MPVAVREKPLICACDLSNFWAFAGLLKGAGQIHRDGVARHLELHDMSPRERDEAMAKLRQIVGGE